MKDKLCTNDDAVLVAVVPFVSPVGNRPAPHKAFDCRGFDHTEEAKKKL